MASVGEIRPSQLMFSYGVGALIDLPQFSALVMGLDYWDKDRCRKIVEPRLLSAVRQCVGRQVEDLRIPPVQLENDRDESIGVPVVPFPRWMRCTMCGTKLLWKVACLKEWKNGIRLCVLSTKIAVKISIRLHLGPFLFASF